MKTVLYILVLCCLVIPATLSAQTGTQELRLLRENRVLQQRIDSLKRALERYEALDEIWSALSGLDDSGWGEGISSIEEDPLPELDRTIASRLSSVFPEMGITYQAEIGERVKSYCRGKNAVILSHALSRLRKHMPYFKKIFAEYGVPEDLIPLCVVESAVSREAVSPVGAAGVWQLMPDTALGYGLRVDYQVDDRFDIEKSTVVAAKVLRDLKRSLGSWPLAVMAYNCGAGRIRKAVIQTGGTDPWEVLKRVPKETQAYLPSLLAVGYLYCYGAEYGIN